MTFAFRDWNGDGVIDHWDDGIQLSMMQMQMEQEEAERQAFEDARRAQEKEREEWLREERISALVRAIREDGSPEIDNDKFEMLCVDNGIWMSDFVQDDITEIQRRLDAYDHESDDCF